MGWFDSQLQERRQKDMDALEDAYGEIVNAVSGRQIISLRSDENSRLEDSIRAILEYWRLRPIPIQEKLQGLDQRLEYMLRPHGIMYRSVELEKGWHKTAYGPMLCFREEDGAIVAMIPNRISGYSFLDYKTGKRVLLTSGNEAQFRADAICFYRPLPQRRLEPWDFAAFVLSSFTLLDFLIPLVLLAVAAVLGVLVPKLNFFLVSLVVELGHPGLLVTTTFFLVCLTVTKLLLLAIQGAAGSRVDMKMSVSVQAALMMRVLSLPSEFFRDYSSGELYSRISGVSEVCRNVLDSVVSVLLTALFSLIYVTQIVQYAPALAVPSLVILLSSLLVSVLTALLQASFDSRRMAVEARESGLLYATISGIRKIKLAGAEDRAFSRWARLYAKRLRHPPTLVKFSTVINTAIILVGNVCLSYLAVKNQVGVAEYFAFNTAYAMVSAAFTALSEAAVSAASAKTVFNLAKPMFQAVPETSARKRVLTRLRGNIEINNLSFRYREDMPNVVENLSLKIKAGEYVAIVGRTGCGKSTLIRLLLGFEKPQKGAVYYDGRDLAGIDLKSLRRRVGVVMQDGKLFAGTIFSNIAISAPWITMEEAWEAAEIAGIADDIRKMPMGMNTVVSENSGGFSGGQRQRLLIAQAVAPKPKILIFDEATSALDNVTQRRVAEALNGMKCTRIVIAHRLSTIKNCDRILVLDGGRVVEDGTYDQLLEKNGIFADLIANQKLDRDGGETVCV